jgi:hypothetical protein
MLENNAQHQPQCQKQANKKQCFFIQETIHNGVYLNSVHRQAKSLPKRQHGKTARIQHQDTANEPYKNKQANQYALLDGL